MDKAKQKNKGKDKSKQAPKEEEEKIEIPKSIYEKDGKVYISIGAKPNAKTSAITGICE